MAAPASSSVRVIWSSDWPTEANLSIPGPVAAPAMPQSVSRYVSHSPAPKTATSVSNAISAAARAHDCLQPYSRSYARRPDFEPATLVHIQDFLTFRDLRGFKQLLTGILATNSKALDTMRAQRTSKEMDEMRAKSGQPVTPLTLGSLYLANQKVTLAQSEIEFLNAHTRRDFRMLKYISERYPVSPVTIRRQFVQATFPRRDLDFETIEFIFECFIDLIPVESRVNLFRTIAIELIDPSTFGADSAEKRRNDAANSLFKNCMKCLSIDQRFEVLESALSRKNNYSLSLIYPFIRFNKMKIDHHLAEILYQVAKIYITVPAYKEIICKLSKQCNLFDALNYLGEESLQEIVQLAKNRENEELVSLLEPKKSSRCIIQ